MDTMSKYEVAWRAMDAAVVGSPVVDDLSITVLAGRVKSAQPGITQAQDAERLGFKRAWLPERYNIKEAGVMLGSMAASTSRIGLGAGPLSVFSRPPVVTAAIGATMQSLYPGRFTLGLGRSNAAWIAGHGFTEAGYQGIVDYADIVKKLWRGETVHYEGPAGTYQGLTMIDRPEGDPPPVVFFHLGGPVASKVAANPVFDQVALCNLTSADVVRRSIAMTRAEAERIGRDPASLYFIAPVTTAPDLSERETRAMVASRIVIGIQLPGMGKALIELNGWEDSWVNEVRGHPQFADMQRALIDHSFHRDGLLGPAELVPEKWLRTSAAVGSSEEVVAALQLYKEAGAHEIDIYAGSPEENARVIELWRKAKGN